MHGVRHRPAGAVLRGRRAPPHLEEKAARLAFGLAKNHASLDGNKRVATACMAAILRLNGRTFRPDAGELLSTMLGVADGTVSYEALIEWVRAQG